MAVLDTNDIFYTTFEPKTQNRFVMYVDGVPAFMINQADPPHFQAPAVEIHHINGYFNIAGKRKWQTANLHLYDPVTPSAAQAVMDWARLTYENVTGRAGYQDFYKKDIVLDMLGPVGDIVSEWIYKGAWVSDMNPGALNWNNQGDPVDLTIQITYDYGVLNF